MNIEKLGPYKIISTLGQGAMGVVYLAVDEQGQKVALKLIRSEFLSKMGSSSEICQRFKREAKYSLKLNHPNIVKTFAAGEIENQLYLACEVVMGGTLANILVQSSKLSQVHALNIIRQVLQGLAEIDSHNLIHRDIKPGNILIGEHEIVKLGDMGLLRPTAEDRTIFTKTGHMAGTPYYMSPEQIEGRKNIDIRCDLYALGAVLYECLCGSPPYTGEFVNVLKKHLVKPVPKIENPEIDEKVSQLVTRLLAKYPDQRPQNPQQVLEEVEEILESLAHFSNPEVLEEETYNSSKTTANKLIPTNTSKHIGLPRAKLTIYGATTQTLFVYAKQNLQIGRNAIDFEGQDICLRPKEAKGMKKISGKHFKIFMQDHKIYITDLKSKFGTILDNKNLEAHIPKLLQVRHKVQVAEVLELIVSVIDPKVNSQYQVTGMGEVDHKAPAVFIERSNNGIEHSYALVSGKWRLGINHKGILGPKANGSAEIFCIGDSLWLCGGDIDCGMCQMLVDGLKLKIDGQEVEVSQIHSEDQKFN